MKLLLLLLFASIHFCAGGSDWLFETASSNNVTLLANVPPPLRDGQTLALQQHVDSLLDRHWKNTNPYSIETRGGKESTYGELTSLGVRQMVYAMDLDETDDVVFMDIGSGAGKLVVQVYLENPLVVVKSIGIEHCSIRHTIAVKSWRRLQNDVYCGDMQETTIASEQQMVEFRNQDAQEADFSDVTHVFMGSLCFPQALTESITISLLQSAPQLRVVAALSNLPRFESSTTNTNTRWEKTMFEVQTTWGRSRLRVYRIV